MLFFPLSLSLLSLSLSLTQSIYLSIYLSISTGKINCQSISMWKIIYQSIYLYISTGHLSIYLSICIILPLCIQGRLKSSLADQVPLIECDQIRFIFQHSLFLWSKQCLDPISQKSYRIRYDVIIWTIQPMDFSAHSSIYLSIYLSAYVLTYVVRHMNHIKR